MLNKTTFTLRSDAEESFRTTTLEEVSNQLDSSGEETSAQASDEIISSVQVLNEKESDGPDLDEILLNGHVSIGKASTGDKQTELIERLELLEAKNKALEECGKQLAQELDVFRQRRLVYWSDRFRNKFDAWHLMHPGFEELKDDTIIFQGDLKGYRLLPSVNLVRVSSMKYELDLARAGLKAILLAPIVDMPSTAGEICVRISGQSQDVLREVSFPLADLSEEQPCELKFPSLGKLSLNKLVVHIFAQNADVPVRIFELRKYPLFGFARIKRKLFAGFDFSD